MFVAFLLLGKPVMAFGAFVIFARVVAPTVAHHITLMTQNLYHPNHKVDHHITPIYGEAQTAKNRGNYYQAIEIYKAIALDFPDETKPYIEMIAIARNSLKDEGLAHSCYTQALQKIETPIKREHIKRFFEEKS